MNDLYYAPHRWYWIHSDGETVYSSAIGAEVPVTDEGFRKFLAEGGEPSPYPKDTDGRESYLELLKVLKSAGLDVPDPSAYVERGDSMYKVKFTKKEFLLWCGLESIVKLNTVIAAGNMTAKTVHDLLFVAEFIDVTDPATITMVQLLTTGAAGGVLTAEDAARILAGELFNEAA